MSNLGQLVLEVKKKLLNKGLSDEEISDKLVGLTKIAFEMFIGEALENLPENLKPEFEKVVSMDGDNPKYYNPELVEKLNNQILLNGKTVGLIFEEKFEKILEKELEN